MYFVKFSIPLQINTFPNLMEAIYNQIGEVKSIQSQTQSPLITNIYRDSIFTVQISVQTCAVKHSVSRSEI